MRFVELRLIAFGHFSDVTLSFAPSPLGLHLLHGHNEAGKSTALRAVHDLLFGVPHASADTFVHSSSELRVGALVEDEHGLRLELVRRKGRKNTLLDPRGAVLDPAATLLPLLGDVDETLFRSMFGLDHEGLRAGARELLSGRGRLSESLFGAGGGGDTHRLLMSLRAQADELFTARGRGKKRINQQIAEVREAHRLVARSSTTAQEYQDRQRELDRARAQVERTKRERAQLKARKSLLDRRLAVLPLVAKLKATLAARELLGPLVELPDGIEEWRQQAVTALQEAERLATFSSTEIERHEALLARLFVPPELGELAWEGSESLSQRLGQFRKARLDLPKREAELRAVQEEARRLLRELDAKLELRDAEALRLTKPEEQRIRRQCAEKVRLDAALNERELGYKEAQRQVGLRRRDLERLPGAVDTTALEAALERARAQYDIDERLDAERRKVRELEKAIDEGLAALGIADELRDTMLSAELPGAAVLARFERDFSSLDAEGRRLAERADALASKLEGHRGELLELEAIGDVPTEAELLRLRGERDAALEGLRNAALRREDSLVRELAAGIRSADQYADRLRLDAARVSRKAHLEAMVRTTLAELERSRAALDERGERRRSLERDWQDTFRPLGVAARLPAEMTEWLAAVVELRRARRALGEAQAEVRRLEGRAASMEKDLADAVRALGESPRTLWESFAQFVQRCRALVERSHATGRARREAEHRLELAQDEDLEHARRFQELKEEQRAFRGEWSKTLRALGLDKDRTPDDVGYALDQRAELFHRLREAAELEKRIQGIVRDEQELERDVKALVAAVAPHLAELPFDVALEKLLRAHKQASEDQREKVRLELELERHTSELEQARRSADRARERLAELLRMARVETLDELLLLERRVSQARTLERQRAELENEILGQGEGEPLETILSRASEVSAEALREESSRIDGDLLALDERLEALVRDHTQAESRLGDLGHGAALAAQELAQKTATLRASVRRFLELKLASSILEREVERYRESHQGPVLRAASELFAGLTLGAYAGLKAGFDERDEPLLLCVTADGREKRIETLSDGTRDQLFLSLRLASVQDLFTRSTPMPLVLDDVLIHFDDERARAALAVLGELARTTQILFFTHHERLVQLAREAVPEGRLSISELGAPRTRAEPPRAG